jgi:cell division protein FtsB
MGGERIQNAHRVKRLRFNCHQPKPRGVLMGTLMPATPTQTLYVSVRRDELRKLKDERDQLRQQVAQLHMMLEQARSGDKAINL